MQAAARNAPAQWQHWWWICIAGELLFIPMIFLMVGRWSPRRARRDAEEHQARIEEDTRQLSGQVAAAD